MMPAVGDDIIRTTGGQIDGMVMALIDSAFDKNEKVKFSILKSLEALGQKQPNLVLSSCHSYLVRHKKLPIGHRICILNIMQQVCSENVNDLDRPLVVEVIKQSVMELITTKDMVPDWQIAASDIIVALGKHFHQEVMEALLVPFQPGIVPHFYVVQTLANLATSNPYGIVPFLKAVMSSMMPMLGAVKQDSMKMAFAHALSKFSESILDYLVNIDKAPDQSVRKEVFANEVNTCYDVLFNSWLNTRDLKLKWAIVQALGNMSHLMSKEKLEEQLPRLLSGILSLYKKHQDHYYITQGLCMVLEAAMNISPTFLAMHLETILSVIFPQVCNVLDYSQPETVKNHNEVLRCFDVLVKNYADQLLTYLLNKVDVGQERPRIGALMVMRHLINSSAEYLSDRMLDVLSGLKPVLNDNNNKVKKVMAQVIVAMAHHGYLECPGSQVMLDFIIRQCAQSMPDSPTRRPTDLEFVSNAMLRSMCENILHLLATTVPKMETVLWPTLLEYLVLDEYVGAINIICKSTAQLANKKRDENDDDYIFNFNKFTNVPRSPAIIARLIALLGHPFTDDNRGVNILRLMKGLVPLLENELVDPWDKTIPQLLEHLKASEDQGKFSQKDWEDKCLKLLSNSLDLINKEEWTLKLGNVFLKQLHLYNEYPDDKNMAMKGLGVVLRKTQSKQFLSTAVSTIFSSIKYNVDAEREGCAVCVGLAAGVHTDALLVKLEEEAKADQKKNSGLFNFIKDMKGGEQEKHNAAFILCYGFLALYAPPNILTSRVETPILRVIAKFYNNSKETAVKISLIHAVDLIAQAVHPSNIMNESFILKSRGELLNQMLNLIKHETVTALNSTLKAFSLSACSNLIKLPPPLSGPNLSTMIQTAAQYTLSIPSVQPYQSNELDGHTYTQEEYTVVLEETLSAFNNLLVQVLLQDFSSESLDFILQNLMSWLQSNNELERGRTMDAVLHLLKSYQENLNLGNKVMLAFIKLGSVLGCLIPRCTDPIIEIRQMAMKCVQLLLQISGSNLSSNSAANAAVPRIQIIAESITSNDSGTLYTATCDFSKVLVDAIPCDQIRSFAFTLFDGLEDFHSQSSSGTSVILKGILTQRGHELRAEVIEALDSIHSRLPRINCPQTKLGALRCIHALAVHHMTPVVSTVLTYALPYDEDDVHLWKSFALDNKLAEEIIIYFLELLNQTAPYVKHQDPRTKNKGVEVKITNQTYAAVICAMTEMFRQSTLEPIVSANFHKIFSALFLAVCSLVDTYPPLPPNRQADPNLQVSFLSSRHTQNQPARWATDSFKSFLLCSQEFGYRIVNNMTDGNFWAALENVIYFPDGIAELARSLAQHSPRHMAQIISFLNSNSNTIYENQRIGVVAMSAELINQKCDNDHALLELLMNSLIGKLVDPSHVIRKLCIRGLSSIAQFGLEEVHKYSTTVLSAMMAGMDDRDDPEHFITLEAMNGLSRVLSGIDEEHIKGIQVNIALKIRPLIEKEQPLVRAAAITLFGDMSKLAKGQSKQPFVEQIHNNFVTLLLHLNDSDSEVVKAAKSTLKMVGPLMDAPQINAMFQKHLIENRVLRYSDFINDLSKEITADVPGKVNFYVTGCVQFFKSTDSQIQGSAVLLAGCLLGNLPEDLRKDISKEHICGALVLLLKDAQIDVKMKTAEAMSLLYSY